MLISGNQSSEKNVPIGGMRSSSVITSSQSICQNSSVFYFSEYEIICFWKVYHHWKPEFWTDRIIWIILVSDKTSKRQSPVHVDYANMNNEFKVLGTRKTMWTSGSIWNKTVFAESHWTMIVPRNNKNFRCASQEGLSWTLEGKSAYVPAILKTRQ